MSLLPEFDGGAVVVVAAVAAAVAVAVKVSDAAPAGGVFRPEVVSVLVVIGWE